MTPSQTPWDLAEAAGGLVLSVNTGVVFLPDAP